MKNYWIQALLFKCKYTKDYRYQKHMDWECHVICREVVEKMIGKSPKYIKLTLSTRKLRGGSQWKVVKGKFTEIVKNLKTGERSLMYSEMKVWLQTLDSDTFWVTVEAVNAATYHKGL